MGIRKLNSKNCWQVNVENICNEIQKYMPKESDKKTRMKFSLYLCSQLMYGVVIVCNYQHKVFLNEVKEAYQRLIKTPFHIINIDLPLNIPMDIDIQEVSLTMLEALDFLRPRESTPSSVAWSLDDSFFSVRAGISEQQEMFNEILTGAVSLEDIERVTMKEPHVELSLREMGLQPEEGEDIPGHDGEDFLAKIPAEPIKSLRRSSRKESAAADAEVLRGPSPGLVPETPASGLFGAGEESGILEPPGAPLRPVEAREPEVTLRDEEPEVEQVAGPSFQDRQKVVASFDLSPVSREELERRKKTTKRRLRTGKGPLIDKNVDLTKEYLAKRIEDYSDTLCSEAELIRERCILTQKEQPVTLFEGSAMGARSKVLERIWQETAEVPAESVEVTEMDWKELWKENPWESMEQAEQRFQLAQQLEQFAQEVPMEETMGKQAEEAVEKAEEAVEKELEPPAKKVAVSGERETGAGLGRTPKDLTTTEGMDETEKLRDEDDRISTGIGRSKRESSLLPPERREDTFLEEEIRMPMEAVTEERTEELTGEKIGPLAEDMRDEGKELQPPESPIRPAEKTEEPPPRKPSPVQQDLSLPYTRPVRYDLRKDTVLKKIVNETEENQTGSVTFDDICPPATTTRYAAAKTFEILLTKMESSTGTARITHAH